MCAAVALGLPDRAGAGERAEGREGKGPGGNRLFRWVSLWGGRSALKRREGRGWDRRDPAPPPRAAGLQRAHSAGPATGAERSGAPRPQDAGGRLQGAEGGRAGEAQRRAAAALEEEALHPHRGGAAARAAQAAAAARARAAGRRRDRRGQGEGAALLAHEDGGLRGAQGQVRLLHRGDGRGQGDRLQVPAGAGLERGDHAAAGAVQEPAGHPGRALHPPEAAAPGAAARAPPAQRLQLRLARPG